MTVETKPLARRWSSPEVAPLAARALVKHSMNSTRAAKELRPHLTEQSARKTGSRMIHTPAVLIELDKIMSGQGVSERNCEKFRDRLWEWFLSTEEGKEANERRLTAARLLARCYITEKLEVSTPPAPRIEGLDEQALRNLTGM